MTTSLLQRIQRGLRMTPHALAKRLALELRRAKTRLLLPLRGSGVSLDQLLRVTGSPSLDRLWERLAARPFVSYIPHESPDSTTRQLDLLCPGELNRILDAANRALSHHVNLLGSGDVWLGERIDWHRDYKTGLGWPRDYSWDVDYTNIDRPSDVKFPWELSRLQWLIPTGQAYCLTGDDRYAAGVRDILANWMDENPPLRGVNWSCTMEIALRVLSWTWFFHVFHASTAWTEGEFRAQFLTNLYAHGQFTEHFLEFSDVNGNHCTADAAALVFAGLFFGDGASPKRWLRSGWNLLCSELTRQVYPDGVDFEGSLAYHRLVLELFLLPALYRERRGLDVDRTYRERVTAMARFTNAYSRSHGSVPLVGDADDGRALPLGGQDVNDHRYLLGLVGIAWRIQTLVDAFSGSRDEVFWWLGPEAAHLLPQRDQRPSCTRISQAFPSSGFFVLANDQEDHVFIDCGPVGLAGRGGHGHNDCLSFEAVLADTHWITDCGSFVYTSSYDERQAFRSTAYHNTPQVDGQEINRWSNPRCFWTLHYDAKPMVHTWETNEHYDLFCGTHSGYQRLPQPVTPRRSIVLHHASHTLVARDEFVGQGLHCVEIPLHLAPGVSVEQQRDGLVKLQSAHQSFHLFWGSTWNWTFAIEPGRVSRRYGVITSVSRLVWRRTGDLVPLVLVLTPSCEIPNDVFPWTSELTTQ